MHNAIHGKACPPSDRADSMLGPLEVKPGQWSEKSDATAPSDRKAPIAADANALVLGNTSKWEKLYDVNAFKPAQLDQTFVSHRTNVYPYDAKSEGLTSYGGLSFSSILAPLYAYHLRVSRQDEIVRSGRKPPQQAYKLYSWLPGTWLYGGELMDHFGHSMAESTHRLHPLTRQFGHAIGSRENIQGVIFAAQSERLPPYMRSLLYEYYGLSPDQVRIVSRQPLTVETLIHAPQGSILGGPCALDGYIDHLAEYQQANLARHKSVSFGQNLFLPRRHIRNSHGEVTNEYLVSEILERYGFREFRPEEHDLCTQLAILSKASRIAIVGGSSVHAFEHLGNISAKGLLISRGDRDSFYHPRPLQQRLLDLVQVEPDSSAGDTVEDGDASKASTTRVTYEPTRLMQTLERWLDE